MRERWYSTYSGFNTFEPSRHGYNDYFKDSIVRLLRTNLNLQKTQPGTEVWKGGNPIEFEYNGNTYYIVVHRLRWNLVEAEVTYESPKLLFDVTIHKISTSAVATFGNAIRSLLGQRSDKPVTSLQLVFRNQIICWFPRTYPHEPPMFRIRGVTRPDDQHSDHMYNGGRLCIFGESSDWNPGGEGDTVYTALLVAIKWIVWHQGKFGKNDLIGPPE